MNCELRYSMEIVIHLKNSDSETHNLFILHNEICILMSVFYAALIYFSQGCSVESTVYRVTNQHSTWHTASSQYTLLLLFLFCGPICPLQQES